MDLVKLKKIILIGFVSVLHTGSFAAVDMLLAANHLQTITVDTPTTNKYESYYQTSENEYNISYTSWEIRSNNAITINFSGESPEGDKTTNTPRFYKQKVNAKDQFIADQYDYLDTKFGAMLLNIDSTRRGSISLTSTGANSSTWGGAEIPNSSSELLVEKTNSSSPNGTWGAIMPSDENDFNLALYSQGVGNMGSQSGVYTLYLTLHVTAEEILNQ